jgi:hypothetical protein
VIVVGSTCAPWKCNGKEEIAWLETADQMRDSADVKFFAALETDRRGLSPYSKLLGHLKYNLGDHWTFSLNDNENEVTSHNRFIRITTGRNLITEYAMRTNATHILFLDTDMRVEGDCLPKLLEVDHPVVGGNVPAYCLGGPIVGNYPFEVQHYMTTAGFLLVSREVFSMVRWRHNGDAGMTDDPCYQYDASLMGFETRVRMDVIGTHVGPLVDVSLRDGDRTHYQ